jgi:hypothetical protein
VVELGVHRLMELTEKNRELLQEKHLQKKDEEALLMRLMNMRILELSPEQVSQAFLCLEKGLKPTPELQELPLEMWGELALILEGLQEEQRHSTIN